MNELDKKQSYEDYLERIIVLKEKNKGAVRSIDLANSFNYSRASISIALKKLVENGNVTVATNGDILLTEQGEKIAKETYEKHLIIGDVFTSLGVPEEIAYEDACKIEHVISDISFEAIKKHYLNHKK